jgi:hypothetical protein
VNEQWLMTDMTAESINEIIEEAVGWTGMKNVRLQDRSRLVTDSGPGFLAHAFEDPPEYAGAAALAV